MKKNEKVGTAVARQVCGGEQGGTVMKMDKTAISKILLCEYPDLSQIMPPELVKRRQDFVDKVYELQKGGRWEDFMGSFPMRTQFIVFIYIKDELNDRQYYELLGQVLGSVYMGDYYHEMLYLIHRRGKRDREFMMSAAERNVLAALDAKVIYRGCGLENRDGYSWTLDLEQAQFFAKRHTGATMVLKGEFDKTDAMAYFDREQEIFIDPRKVRNITVIEEHQNGPRERWDVHGNIYAMTVEDPVYREFRQEIELGFAFINQRNHGDLEALGPDFKREVLAGKTRRRQGGQRHNSIKINAHVGQTGAATVKMLQERKG